jgi:hypothetical protein
MIQTIGIAADLFIIEQASLSPAKNTLWRGVGILRSRGVSSARARPVKGEQAAATSCNKSVSQLGSSTYRPFSMKLRVAHSVADPVAAR